MVEPQWILEEVVLAVHQIQLARHSGIAGVRDAGLLSSASHRPQELWNYSSERPDVAALAGAYAFGISSSHSFLDGNKGTGGCRLRNVH